MFKEAPTPFPSLAEVIRYLSNALDTKCANKKIDEAVRDLVVAPAKLTDLINEIILAPLQNVDQQLVERVRQLLDNFFRSYASLVASVAVDGITRDELMVVISHWVGRVWMKELITLVIVLLEPPENFDIKGKINGSIVKLVIELCRTKATWNAFEESLEKEDKDRIRTWHNKTHLPSLQYIKLIGNGNYDCWKKIRSALVIARVIDFINQDAFKLKDLFDFEYLGFKESVVLIQQSKKEKYQEIIPIIAYLNSYLIVANDRSSKEETKEKINQLKSWLKNNKNEHYEYWAARSEAYWNVYSGDLERANSFFKLAFEKGVYRMGSELELLVNRAFAVASNLKTPDRTFMKKLKWAGVLFGFDFKQIDTQLVTSNFSDSIADWEVEAWAKSFYRVFPRDFFFEGVSLPVIEQGGIIIVNSDALKPDYKSPNKVIRIGEKNATRRYPQLVWFTQDENYEAVETLLELGADVNKKSEVGDTALLMALQSLNPAGMHEPSMDERFWSLLSQKDHLAPIVNQITSKKRLTPLAVAIQTGRPEVVRKILDMQADPNLRALVNLQSPLYISINILGLAKKPEELEQIFEGEPSHYIDLNMIKRFMPNYVASTLESSRMKNILIDQANSNLNKSLRSAWVERFNRYICADNMRDIALLLIKAGADPNAKHEYPIGFYTPLAFAKELDEKTLTHAMEAK